MSELAHRWMDCVFYYLINEQFIQSIEKLDKHLMYELILFNELTT